MSVVKKPACIAGLFYKGHHIGACLILGGRFSIEMVTPRFPADINASEAAMAIEKFVRELKDANPFTPEELRRFKIAADERKEDCTLSFLPPGTVQGFQRGLSKK